MKLGCGEHYLTAEATPDIYIRKQAPVVYLAIGEVERIGSRDPEMQLAIGAQSLPYTE